MDAKSFFNTSSGLTKNVLYFRMLIERDGKVTGFIAKWQKKDGQEIYVRENSDY